jgi:cell division septal protein FtsQ
MIGARSHNERLAMLEQKVSHMEAELGKMSAKVDEMHVILLQARGVRWAIIAVSGVVGFLVGVSQWIISRA